MESCTLQLHVVVTGLPGHGILLVDCLKLVKHIFRLKVRRSNVFKEDDERHQIQRMTITISWILRNNDIRSDFESYDFLLSCIAVAELFWARTCRRGMLGSILGRACRLSHSHFSVAFSETRLNTG